MGADCQMHNGLQSILFKRRLVFSSHQHRLQSLKAASVMAALLCRTYSRPLGVAFEQLHQSIAALPFTPLLPALSQLHTHSVACNLRAWHSRTQPPLAGKTVKRCRVFCASSGTDAAVDTRPKLVFLGTPEVIISTLCVNSRAELLLSSCLRHPFGLQVAADVLFKLLTASRKPNSLFQVLLCTAQLLNSNLARYQVDALKLIRTMSMPSYAQATLLC